MEPAKGQFVEHVWGKRYGTKRVNLCSDAVRGTAEIVDMELRRIGSELGLPFSSVESGYGFRPRSTEVLCQPERAVTSAGC
jgi:hypothetical protein